MAKRMIANMYKDVGVRESPESYVDDLWAGILREYFPNDYFQVVIQTPPRSSSHLRADLAVWHEHSSNKIILFESKRRDFESQSSVWREAVEQLEEYFVEMRKTRANKTKTYYAGVAIGRYVRFYILHQGWTELQDYEDPNATVQAYEVSKNEKDIHRVLSEWAGKFV